MGNVPRKPDTTAQALPAEPCWQPNIGPGHRLQPLTLRTRSLSLHCCTLHHSPQLILCTSWAEFCLVALPECQLEPNLVSSICLSLRHHTTWFTASCRPRRPHTLPCQILLHVNTNLFYFTTLWRSQSASWSHCWS